MLNFNTNSIYLVVICFDFGLRRIGVAVGTSLTNSARSLTTVPNKKGKWLIINQLIKEWQPNLLVIGVPYSNKTSLITKSVIHFKNQLQNHFALPTISIDERLSSWAAKQQLQINTSVQKIHNSIDSTAAAIILESWFNQHYHYSEF